MHTLGIGIDIAVGIYISMKTLSRRDVIFDFNTRNFDQTVSRLGVEAGRFGVEAYFAGHGRKFRLLRRRGPDVRWVKLVFATAMRRCGSVS